MRNGCVVSGIFGRNVGKPDVAYNRCFDGWGHLCQRMDRRAERDRNLRDNAMYVGQKRNCDECGV